MICTEPKNCSLSRISWSQSSARCESVLSEIVWILVSWLPGLENATVELLRLSWCAQIPFGMMFSIEIEWRWWKSKSEICDQQYLLGFKEILHRFAETVTLKKKLKSLRTYSKSRISHLRLRFSSESITYIRKESHLVNIMTDLCVQPLLKMGSRMNAENDVVLRERGRKLINLLCIGDDPIPAPTKFVRRNQSLGQCPRIQHCSHEYSLEMLMIRLQGRSNIRLPHIQKEP